MKNENVTVKSLVRCQRCNAAAFHIPVLTAEQAKKHNCNVVIDMPENVDGNIGIDVIKGY